MLEDFFKLYSTPYNFIHKKTSYDLVLWLIGMPLMLAWLYKISQWIGDKLDKTPEIISIAIYLYLFVLMLLVFRISFNYTRYKPRPRIDAHLRYAIAHRLPVAETPETRPPQTGNNADLRAPIGQPIEPVPELQRQPQLVHGMLYSIGYDCQEEPACAGSTPGLMRRS